MKLEKIKAITDLIVGVVTNKKVKKTVLGEYADGKTRSIIDCIDGEFLSPSERKRYIKKKKKKGNKKKKYNDIIFK